MDFQNYIFFKRHMRPERGCSSPLNGLETLFEVTGTSGKHSCSGSHRSRYQTKSTCL